MADSQLKKLERHMTQLLQEYESRPPGYWHAAEFPLVYDRCFDGEVYRIEVGYIDETDSELLLLLALDGEDARYSSTQQLTVRKHPEPLQIRQFHGGALLTKVFNDAVRKLEKELGEKGADYWSKNPMPEGQDITPEDEVLSLVVDSKVESDTHVLIRLRGTLRCGEPALVTASVFARKSGAEAGSA